MIGNLESSRALPNCMGNLGALFGQDWRAWHRWENEQKELRRRDARLQGSPIHDLSVKTQTLNANAFRTRISDSFEGCRKASFFVQIHRIEGNIALENLYT